MYWSGTGDCKDVHQERPAFNPRGARGLAHRSRPLCRAPFVGPSSRQGEHLGRATAGIEDDCAYRPYPRAFALASSRAPFVGAYVAHLCSSCSPVAATSAARRPRPDTRSCTYSPRRGTSLQRQPREGNPHPPKECANPATQPAKVPTTVQTTRHRLTNRRREHVGHVAVNLAQLRATSTQIFRRPRFLGGRVVCNPEALEN